MSASKIRAFKSKWNAIKYLLPGTTDPNDCYLYPLVAPPPNRPEQERRQVRSESFLCDVCRAALEYLAYVVEECRSKQSTAYNLNLLEVAAHHQNLAVWLENIDLGCHLCYFLISHLRAPPDGARRQKFLSRTQIELSWDTKFTETGDRGRLYVALTRPGEGRTQANYHIYMRLQVWPAKDFAHLFAPTVKLRSASPSSSKLDEDASREDTPVTSNDVYSSTPILDTSYNGNEGNNSERSDADENIDFSGDGSDDHGSVDHDSDDDVSNADQSEADRLDGDGGGLEGDSSDTDGADDDSLGDQDYNNIRVILEVGSTGSRLTHTLSAGWLARCQNNEDGQHLECNRAGGNWLPTRLLDTNYTSEDPVLRLVSPMEAPEIFNDDRRYITLSHCWGEWGSKELPVLKLSNEHDRIHNGIGLADLPRTFQHAVVVARGLNVRWLWIDSLCIIQDCDEDWQREAPFMHDVYKEGFLNIAATSAVDARGGLFQPRPPIAVQPLQLNMPGTGDEWYVTVDERNMFEWIDTAPLSRRAWVFQERHLARRVLHFTKDEVFWECCAKAPYFASETFPNGAPLNKTFNDKPKMQSESLLGKPLPSIQGVYDLWEDLCQTYSEKHLSHGGDKLVALLGLAKEFKQLIPSDKYLAGMWLSTMPGSLLWEVEERYGSQPTDRQVDVAPSWSWASIHGPIRKHFRHKTEQEVCVSVVDIKVGSLSDGSRGLPTPNLIVSGFVRRVTIKDNLAVNTVLPPSYGNKKKLLVHQGPQQLTVRDAGISYSLDSNIRSEITHAYFLF
ncbi:MAG: hypothetical protein Q9208_006807 [Pyrenodesmia sp. 3 TL-2023]